jgi:hypothetical protein
MADPATNTPYSDGDQLVMRQGAVMPPRCPICNSADVAPPIEVRFAVQRKGGVIGDAVSKGIDAVKGWNYTGPVTVRIPFCARHRARRTYAIAGGLVLAAAGGIILFFSGPLVQGRPPGAASLFGFALLAIGIIMTLATLSGVLNLWFKPRRFTGRTVWVSGASPAYLYELPARPRDAD